MAKSRRTYPVVSWKKTRSRSYNTHITQRPEKKYKDVQVSINASNDPAETDGVEMLNNNILSGTATYNRIGNKTQMLYLKINGYTDMGSMTALASGFSVQSRWIRFFVIYDKQPDGAKFTIGDFLRQSTSTQAIQQPEIQHTNVNNLQRFKVLLSKKINLTNQSYSDGDTGVHVTGYANKGFSYYVKIPRKHSMSTYKASSGSEGDVSGGSYYVLAVSNGPHGVDSGTSSNEYPTLKMIVRMCFYG